MMCCFARWNCQAAFPHDFDAYARGPNRMQRYKSLQVWHLSVFCVPALRVTKYFERPLTASCTPCTPCTKHACLPGNIFSVPHIRRALAGIA